ncbi:MAG: methyltransferase domain-containing protein [Archangiaceae bacterium]|nr:methyltransferase domain-containing protein [Archangiaceae bacterium]
MPDSKPDLRLVLHGAFAVPALSLFGELGFADRWVRGETLDVQAIATERGLDGHRLAALTDYFVRYGYLERKGAAYAATPLGRELLAVWPAGMIFHAYGPLLADLIPVVRKEKQYGYGKEVTRDIALDTKASGRMGIAWGLFQRVVGYLVQHRHTHLLDFGCGDGTFLEYAASQFPDLSVVGVDQSATAVANARKRFADAGLGGRAAVFQGDLAEATAFLDDPKVREADVATVFYILHEIAHHGLDTVRTFLRQYRQRLGHVKLAVTEYYRPADDAWPSYMDRGIPEVVLYHDLSNQRLLHRDEWLQLYESEGFKVLDHLEAQQPGVPATVGTAILTTG